MASPSRNHSRKGIFRNVVVRREDAKSARTSGSDDPAYPGNLYTFSENACMPQFFRLHLNPDTERARIPTWPRQSPQCERSSWPHPLWPSPSLYRHRSSSPHPDCRSSRQLFLASSTNTGAIPPSIHFLTQAAPLPACLAPHIESEIQPVILVESPARALSAPKTAIAAIRS